MRHTLMWRFPPLPTRVQKGTTMHKISLPITALGLALLAGPAYADDDCEKNPGVVCAAKQFAKTAKELSGYYSGAKTVFDVAEKYAQMVGWLPTPPTLQEVYDQIDDQIVKSTNGGKWDSD